VDALPLYCLEKKPAITGDVIVDAAFEPDEMGNRNIMLTFNDEGKEQFSTLTAGSIGKKIAITVDSMVYTAPVVQAEITEGRAIITGHEDLNKTKILAYIIKAGPLPCLFTVEKITE
jgi:preprotein translocase subunit SecD